MSALARGELTADFPRRVDLVLPPPGTRDFSGGRADSPLSLMVIAASRVLLISASFPGHLSRLSVFKYTLVVLLQSVQDLRFGLLLPSSDR